jgi:hypothetical protein
VLERAPGGDAAGLGSQTEAAKPRPRRRAPRRSTCAATHTAPPPPPHLGGAAVGDPVSVGTICAREVVDEWAGQGGRGGGMMEGDGGRGRGGW